MNGFHTKELILSTLNSLNERFDYPIKKIKKTYRIITLGNSFTYGLYVDTKDNWTEQLEDRLNQQKEWCPNITKFEVINLGVYGCDTKYEVERFKIRGQKYNLNIVLWLITNLDRIDELLIPKSNAYDQIMKTDGSYKLPTEKGDYYPAWTKAQQDIVSTLGHQQILNIQSGYFKKFSQYYNNKLILFTFPFFEDKNFLKNIASTMHNAVFYYDIPNIYKSGDFLPDGHPNKIGYTKIAKNIYKYLVTNKLIPCN